MPLLARLVIAVAMLTSGWLNCFGQVQIRTEIADGLRAMDIEVRIPVQVETPPIIEEGEEVAEPPQESTAIRTTETTRGGNRIVWLIHDKWPDLRGWGTFIAWSAAVAQLIAGVLLLVGLFTRLAALTICIATGMAIYIVSDNVHGMFTMNPFDWPLHHARFSQLLTKLCLLVLALGIVVGGPGMFSIDRFQAARHRDPDLSSGKGAN